MIQNGAFHTCRKAYATQKYKEYREGGLSVKAAMSKVSVNLGHGTSRFELMKEYICTDLIVPFFKIFVQSRIYHK